MAGTAEKQRFEVVDAPEVVNRRTDDILFNLRYLHANILDRNQGTFAPGVEDDVMEQNITEIAEADVHKLGPIVYQRWDENLGQYTSLGGGSFDTAKRGYEAVDPADDISWFELGRRLEEVIDEAAPLDSAKNEQLRRGAIKLMISPEPTHHEADPDVAASFGYDGRTMFRLQRLSPDGKTKSMQSFSMFNAPAAVWAEYLSDRYATEIEPTALAVMRFSNEIMLDAADTNEVLLDFIGGFMKYLDEDEASSVERQLDGFLTEQDELRAQAAYYGREKLDLQKELALSYGRQARPAILNLLRDVSKNLNEQDAWELQMRFSNGELHVDEYVAELAIKIKTLTNDNRAGLATLNEHTVMRMASKIGLEATLELAAQERAIQANVIADVSNDFLVRRTEQIIAESGVSCGGACSVSVVDLFSKDAATATAAGLSGKLYKSSELDKGSKCGCTKSNKKAKVISDGKNVVCVTCGDYQSRGKRGSLKKTASKQDFALAA